MTLEIKLENCDAIEDLGATCDALIGEKRYADARAYVAENGDIETAAFAKVKADGRDLYCAPSFKGDFICLTGTVATIKFTDPEAMLHAWKRRQELYSQARERLKFVAKNFNSYRIELFHPLSSKRVDPRSKELFIKLYVTRGDNKGGLIFEGTVDGAWFHLPGQERGVITSSKQAKGLRSTIRYVRKMVRNARIVGEKKAGEPPKKAKTPKKT